MSEKNEKFNVEHIERSPVLVVTVPWCQALKMIGIRLKQVLR